MGSILTEAQIARYRHDPIRMAVLGRCLPATRLAAIRGEHWIAPPGATSMIWQLAKGARVVAEPIKLEIFTDYV